MLWVGHTHGAERAKRLPGFTAAPPSRHNGQSSGSYLAMGRSSRACVSTPSSSRAAAAVDQSSSGNHSPTRLFDHLNGFLRRAAGRPYIFDHQHVLIRFERESAAQGHRTAAVALRRKIAGTPLPTVPFGSGKARATSCPITTPPSAGETTAAMTASEKSAASACPKLLGKSRVLQHERTLHVSPAVQAAGKLKMAVPDGSGGLKHAQQFFS